jgi:hypothetical protein
MRVAKNKFDSKEVILLGGSVHAHHQDASGIVELPKGQEVHVKRLKGFVLGGALLSAGQVMAEDNTAAEIRLLKEKLKQLEQRVERQGQKESETRAKLASIKDPVFVKGSPSTFDPCPPGKFCYKGITVTPGGCRSRRHLPFPQFARRRIDLRVHSVRNQPEPQCR